MRAPIVAGMFYENNLQELEKQIKASFLHKLGPGDLATKRNQKGIVKGLIAPHAGYQFSGPCAAWGYKEIAEHEFPELFIILGPSHQGFGSCLSADDWQTPFGVVKTDKNFINELSKNTGLKINEEAHASEHSIEVQLPFLQFVCKDKLNEIRIVPVMISNDIDYEKLGADIKKTIGNRKITVIASSDFTHYGINYGYMPFIDNVKENLHDLDDGAISYIKAMKVHKFIEYVEEKKATICGKLPIAVLMQSITAEKVKLLLYCTSGDITGDYGSAVGYASILFV